MIHVGIDMFTLRPERYIEMAKTGTDVYIILDDGTELKLCRKE